MMMSHSNDRNGLTSENSSIHPALFLSPLVCLSPLLLQAASEIDSIGVLGELQCTYVLTGSSEKRTSGNMNRTSDLSKGNLESSTICQFCSSLPLINNSGFRLE